MQVKPHADAEQFAVLLAGTGQACPQPPQLATLVVVSVSQPSAARPSQLANGLLQANPQDTPSQVAVAFAGTEHGVQELVPQLAVELLLTHAPLQLWKPELQTNPQMPLVQVGLPLAMVHMEPQPPQFARLVLVLTSHPSVGSLLQSEKPGLHESTAQAPLTHAAVPLATLQTFPQAPQLLALVLVLTSHPLAGSWSQSAKPVSQAATVQALLLHPAVALARVQTFPQAPQFAGLVLVFTSQPSVGSLLQSPKPALHEATVHAPAAHPAVALARVQTVPQAPQLLGSTAVCTSQPSESLVLQLAQPAWQAMPQTLALHLGSAFARSGQTWPQEPQLMADVDRSISQPSVASVSQSANGSMQVMPHVEAAQVALLCAGTGQACAQAPQFARSVRPSISQPLVVSASQLRKPALHGPMSQDPLRQTRLALA